MVTPYTFNRLGRISVAMLLVGISACTSTVDVAENIAPPTRVSVAAAEPTAVVAHPSTTPSEPATPAAEPVPEPTMNPEPTATSIPPTPAPAPTTVAVADQDHNGLAGSRGLTLQWISWEPQDWGTVTFVPLVDGSYAVDGTQTGPDGDFVSVNGTIVRVTDRELRFSGEVIVQVSYTNDGQPCVRTGDLTFLATGDRRFWRMQDLLNCDGIVTDYVDIYFG